MIRLPAIALLTGCHVLATGDIAVSCDELDNCPATEDDHQIDDDAIDFGTGLALNYQSEDRGVLSLLNPPTLQETAWATWDGELDGALAFGQGQVFLATQGVVYAFSQPGAQPRTLPGPDEDVRDMVVDGDVLWMVSEAAVYSLDLSSDELVSPDATANQDWGELLSVTLDNDGGVLILDLDLPGAQPDLWRLDPRSGTLDTVASDFATNRSPCGAGVFVTPDDGVYTCSIAGAVFSLDELTRVDGAVDMAVQEAYLNASVTDVLECGWAPDDDRFVVVSATLGAWGVVDAQDDLPLFPTDGDDYQIRSASLF